MNVGNNFPKKKKNVFENDLNDFGDWPRKPARPSKKSDAGLKIFLLSAGRKYSRNGRICVHKNVKGFGVHSISTAISLSARFLLPNFIKIDQPLTALESNLLFCREEKLSSDKLGLGDISPGKDYPDFLGANMGLLRSPAVHDMDLALNVGMGEWNDGLFKAVM